MCLGFASSAYADADLLKYITEETLHCEAVDCRPGGYLEEDILAYEKLEQAALPEQGYDGDGKVKFVRTLLALKTWEERAAFAMSVQKTNPEYFDHLVIYDDLAPEISTSKGLNTKQIALLQSIGLTPVSQMKLLLSNPPCTTDLSDDDVVINSHVIWSCDTIEVGGTLLITNGGHLEVNSTSSVSPDLWVWGSDFNNPPAYDDYPIQVYGGTLEINSDDANKHVGLWVGGGTDNRIWVKNDNTGGTWRQGQMIANVTDDDASINFRPAWGALGTWGGLKFESSTKVLLNGRYGASSVDPGLTIRYIVSGGSNIIVNTDYLTSSSSFEAWIDITNCALDSGVRGILVFNWTGTIDTTPLPIEKLVLDYNDFDDIAYPIRLHRSNLRDSTNTSAKVSISHNEISDFGVSGDISRSGVRVSENILAADYGIGLNLNIHHNYMDGYGMANGFLNYAIAVLDVETDGIISINYNHIYDGESGIYVDEWKSSYCISISIVSNKLGGEELSTSSDGLTKRGIYIGSPLSGNAGSTDVVTNYVIANTSPASQQTGIEIEQVPNIAYSSNLYGNFIVGFYYSIELGEDVEDLNLEANYMEFHSTYEAGRAMLYYGANPTHDNTVTENGFCSSSGSGDYHITGVTTFSSNLTCIDNDFEGGASIRFGTGIYCTGEATICQ